MPRERYIFVVVSHHVNNILMYITRYIVHHNNSKAFWYGFLVVFFFFLLTRRLVLGNLKFDTREISDKRKNKIRLRTWKHRSVNCSTHCRSQLTLACDYLHSEKTYTYFIVLFNGTFIVSKMKHFLPQK